MAYPLWHWAKRLLSGQPHLRIHPGEYLDRWYLIPRNRFFNIYLHRFHGSDPGRHLHDHPWWSLSIVLRGHYTEVLPERPLARRYGVWGNERVRLPGSFVLRRPTDQHTLVRVARPTWTLFLTGPRVREWGFWENGEWVPWEEYYRRHDLPLD
jgi:hypothetical protein